MAGEFGPEKQGHPNSMGMKAWEEVQPPPPADFPAVQSAETLVRAPNLWVGLLWEDSSLSCLQDVMQPGYLTNGHIDTFHTRITDYSDTWLGRCLATWTLDYQGSWILRYLDTWLPGNLAICLTPGYLDPGYLNT
jgi:hypothetical protein